MKLLLQNAAAKVAVFFLLLMSVCNVSGQVTLPHYDGMVYAAGASLQTQTTWAFLNTGDNLVITTPSLTYTGLQASTGEKVAFDAGGIDATKAFTPTTTGKVYYSFLLNVTALGSLGTTGGYFTSFTDATTGFGATVWTRADGAGFDIGLNPRTTAANTVWTSGTTSLNTTVLVVISYEIVTGAINDNVKLWINPTPGLAEPGSTLSATNTLADLTSLNRILMRQDAIATTPFIEMDELRIGTTWESVTPAAVGGGTILATGTIPLASLSTIYGTASTTTNFDISGTSLNAGITITPPLGFEVATSSDFSTTIGTSVSPLSVGSAPTVSNTTIYVRLAANATAGNKTGTIQLSSSGSSPVTVATNATNTVSQKGLTITGLTANDKPYDTTTTATLSGTAVLNTVVSGDEPNVILGGTVVANFDTAAIGNNKPVTVTGYTITGSKAANYSLAQPTGLTANITSVATTPQTITFNPLTPVTYGVGTVTLGATSDSNLAVTCAISPLTGIATISGNVLTIVGAGTLTITASQAGDATYLPATNVVQSLVVNPKDVTILNPSAIDKLYDGTTTATINGTLQGVINSDVVTLNLIANFADANVGTNKPVTSTSTITGTDASKYNLIQPLGLTAAILLAPCNATPGVITWNFTDTNGDPLSNTSSTLVSAISRGNNNGTTNTLINSTSASNVYVGFSAGNNAGVATFTGALNTTTSSYFEFTLTPPAGYSVTLNGISFGSRSTSTGPQAFVLRSSLDGYVNDLASGTFLNNSVWAIKTPTVVNTTNVNPTITYRIYGYNGTGTAALNSTNWRIDDLKLNISETLLSPLSSAISAATCSGSTFNYTPTTNLPGTTITWKRAAVAGISNPEVTTPQASNVSETLINTTNASIDVVYEFTISNGNCFLIQNVTVSVQVCSSIVNLKLFIEGYYEGTAMRSVKNNQDGVSPTDQVEDIVVELHNATSPYTTIASTVATLKTDGTALCIFSTAPNGSFYIAVKNSNATQTWSSSPQTVGAIPLTYDFSSAANKAYGDNMIEVGVGVFAFYSGDINQDEVIDGSDATFLDLDIFNSESGIKVTDLNGDGSVDGSDATFFENNQFNSIFAIYPQ